MFRSQKLIVGLIVAVLLVAMLVLGATGLGFYHSVEAAMTAPANSRVSIPNLLPQYFPKFLSSFVNALFADKGNYNSAFSDAIQTTLNQAVKDGKLTQAQANAIENSNSGNLASLRGGFNDFGFGTMGMGSESLITTSDIANALGITDATLTADLRSGKSIAEIAKAQNKDLATVKQTLLADAKSELATEVSNKTLTQSQADQLYQNLSDSIDNLLNSTQNSSMGNNGSFPGMPGNPGNQGRQNQNQGPRM